MRIAGDERLAFLNTAMVFVPDEANRYDIAFEKVEENRLYFTLTIDQKPVLNYERSS